ncbi:MAG: rubrerythrin [Bacteroidia bacterium]|jgi:rubrerythrin
MKLRLIFLIAGMALLFAACGESKHAKKARTDHEHLNQGGNSHTGPAYTSKYICPMHCEGSGSDTTGNCPVCKMDYVTNPSE